MDLDPDLSPVTLHYSGPLETALNLICELSEFSWSVENGKVRLWKPVRPEPVDPEPTEPVGEFG